MILSLDLYYIAFPTKIILKVTLFFCIKNVTLPMPKLYCSSLKPKEAVVGTFVTNHQSRSETKVKSKPNVELGTLQG
jgi:hypothetical protein